MMYMLDTNICIYTIRQRPASVLNKLYEKMHQGLCISSITLAELEHGVAASSFPEQNAIALRQFLTSIDVLHFDDEAATCYGSLRVDLKRNNQLIGPLDMLIAAHALSQDMTLVTNNMREFVRVKGLKLDNWVAPF